MSAPFLDGMLKKRTLRQSYNGLSKQEIQLPQSFAPTPFFISNCEGCTFDLSLQKVTNIQIERCSSTVKLSSVISSIELIACKDSNIQLENPDQAGTIVMDECENIKLFGQGNFDMWNLISIGSSGISLVINGLKHEIPSSIGGSNGKLRLKSYKKGNTYISETCDNYGNTK